MASLLDLTPAQVHDTATFYTMYRFSPRAGTTSRSAPTSPARSRARTSSSTKLCDRLGIEEGGTTADGEWTVHRAECLAACGGATAVQVDGRWVEYATPTTRGDRHRRARERPFDWPKSPGEMILLRNVFEGGLGLARDLQAGRRLREAEGLPAA